MLSGNGGWVSAPWVYGAWALIGVIFLAGARYLDGVLRGLCQSRWSTIVVRNVLANDEN